MSPIDLQVGDVVTRNELVIEYGGSRYSGGIVPSNQSQSVFVFTDPAEGRQFGYVYDGFSPEGDVFFYTGAGQDGDQVESGANSPIMSHAAKGRSLHAFVAAGTVPGTQTKRQRYIGEFILDPAAPYDRMPALDRSNALRTVIVFRLLPVHAIPEEIVESVGFSGVPQSHTMLVPTEINSTHFFETSGQPDRVAIRRESALVEEFIATRPDHRFHRWAITIPTERTRLLTDVYDGTSKMLFEAKALSGRNDLRMAVGQLYDYRRHIDVPGLECAVLLPERPSSDLRDYLAHSGLGLAYRVGDRDNSTFVIESPPR